MREHVQGISWLTIRLPQMESVTWTQCGPEINVCWLVRELGPSRLGEEGEDKIQGAHAKAIGGQVVVCNPARRGACITLYYPDQLSDFFSDQGLHRALEPGNFLNKACVLPLFCVVLSLFLLIKIFSLEPVTC